MAAYTDQHVASLRRSLADGRVACRAPVDRTIDILAELLGRPDGGLAAAGARSGDWTRSRAGPPRSASGSPPSCGTPSTREIRPAFARLHDALVTEILPAARPAERPGMCHVRWRPGRVPRPRPRPHVPGPRRRRSSTGSASTRSTASTRRWTALAGRTLGTANLADALAALRGDPALYFTTRDEVYEKAASSLARATEAIPDWFGRLPRRRARSSGWAPTRRCTPPSPTTASRRWTARGPASTTSTRRRPGPGRATRRRRSPTTSRSRATTSRSPSARS